MTYLNVEGAKEEEQQEIADENVEAESAENDDLLAYFLHVFHRTPSCRAILKYNAVPLFAPFSALTWFSQFPTAKQPRSQL